jgi:UV DNA damage endonuclease
MIRLGLCCIFKSEPIRFRRTTAKYVSGMGESRRLEYLSGLSMHNAESLMASLRYCLHKGIGGFRINSQILPLKTHPEFGYEMKELPGYNEIVKRFKECGGFGKQNDIRTTFHPDQFIVLSSPNRKVVQNSVRDLRYHAEVASWVHADVINIHAGGAYGDKKSALKRLKKNIFRLPKNVREKLALENDDRVYTPEDLLPVCGEMNIPFVYDLHHHRCLPDGMDEEKVTEHAITTWDREPVFHVSSPIGGWEGSNPRKHHDYVDINDFPNYWLNYDLTVEVEAKAKEEAVLRLKNELRVRE